MGIRSWLGLPERPQMTAAASTDIVQAAAVMPTVASPWSTPNHLAPIVVEDIYGLKARAVTRSEAMQVPAVAKARQLICETLARQPIKVYGDGALLDDQPTWSYRTDSEIGPRLRMAWTLDDLLFYGFSLWAVVRGAADQLLDAVRVPQDAWRFDSLGRVEVRRDGVSGSVVWVRPEPGEVLLFQGAKEGLLETAGRTIRAFRELEDAWHSRVSTPLPTTVITPPADSEPEPEEMRDIRDQYINARRDTNGAVVVMPAGWTLETRSMEGLDLFEEGRNAAVLEIARFTGIPAAMLDASNVNASSVNYANNAVKRNEFHDLSLRNWALPIEERLSLDDVVPRGQSVQFDLAGLVTTPDTGTGPILED